MNLLLFALLTLINAQLPPPTNRKTIPSKHHPGVSISYKPSSLCETTSNSYTGHIHLPPHYLTNDTSEFQPYPINTFFWFFEARHDPSNAPLAIWLQGGPGGSSLIGLFTENGPCKVNADSRTTRLNPWSWNKHVNMLYIDQPLQTGFSYDTPTNCTVNLDGSGPGAWEPTDFSDGVPESNNTYWVGTMASQDPAHTANSTDYAAHILWHFVQTFFDEFPGYKPNNNRLSIWAESYGGHFAPATMKFFQDQNERITNGTIGQHAHHLHLDTMGIINGVVDSNIQIEAMIRYPHNNSYNIQLYNQSHHDKLLHNFLKPGGCRDQVLACRGNPPPENCTQVDGRCINALYYDYLDSTQRSIYNLAYPMDDPFPLHHHLGFLRERDVLASIGSPVNFTDIPTAVQKAFDAAFDHLRNDLDNVAYLLDHGVKVHLVYGDLDWVANWVGGEKTSLAIPYSQASDFAKVGYAKLLSGEQHKGFTRQLGNLSFTRVFDAGHMVPGYQPRAAYNIFTRAIFNKDVATGEEDVTDDYATKGPQSVWQVKGQLPKVPKTKCYVLAPGTCTEEELARVASGRAVIKDYYLVDSEKDAFVSQEL